MSNIARSFAATTRLSMRSVKATAHAPRSLRARVGLASRLDKRLSPHLAAQYSMHGVSNGVGALHDVSSEE